MDQFFIQKLQMFYERGIMQLSEGDCRNNSLQGQNAQGFINVKILVILIVVLTVYGRKLHCVPL